MRTTIVTPCTPSTMTRTITTRTICTSEHSSAPLVVLHVSLMMCHTTLAQVVHVSVISSSRHVYVRSSLTSSTSLSTSTCPSPSSSTPLSWCTLTCTPTSTTWNLWQITCATPPRGALTPTDVIFSLTGYEPNDTVSNELVDSQGPFSYVVSQSSLSVASDRTGKPVGESSSSAQIRTLFDEQRRTIIEGRCEKVSHHELQAARAEQDRQFLTRRIMASAKRIYFREVHQQILTEMDGGITEIPEFFFRYAREAH